MKADCFECGQSIVGDDVDAVVDAFVAHGKANHEWPYPEEAVRNYARNFAEATQRLTGATERQAEIGDITVHPMTEDRIDDWLQFFDHDAFADNPGWASCYCLEPHEPAPPEMPERPWRKIRTRMVERLRAGATCGYLAYVDDRPAGWVNASLRSEYDFLKDVDTGGLEPDSVIGISCLIIAPPFRGYAIASTLLDRVIADASTRGASWIEGYPHNEPKAGNAGHFRGPRSMYDARGFETVEVRERVTVMRLSAKPVPGA
jgi:GNAT superfamily N-acetyltransferase